MAKAKLLQPFAEKLITIGKRNNQASLRLIVKKTNNEKIAKIIMHHVAPRFLQKKGGYTRILKLGRKSSDGAERVILEMTLQ